MSREEYIAAKEFSPIFFEVCKWYGEVNFLRLCILSNRKLEAYLGREVDTAFMKFTLVISCDFGVLSQEVGNNLKVDYNIRRWGCRIIVASCLN